MMRCDEVISGRDSKKLGFWKRSATKKEAMVAFFAKLKLKLAS